MHAVLAGLTTRDEIHRLDRAPDPLAKATSLAHLTAAGGPATNAAVAVAALCAIDEGGDDTVSLLTALGPSDAGRSLAAELAGLGVQVLDAARSAQPGPAASSIVEHPAGRMVVSTDAQVHTDPIRLVDLVDRDRAQHGLPDVVLVDGHHPELADAVLRQGTSSAAGDPAADPFADLEDHPSHLRILDGGSWKPAFVPLLGRVDVAVISADFRPPLLPDADAATRVEVQDAIAGFLAGFGITKVVRTDGPHPVRWWWDGATGEVPVGQADSGSGSAAAFPSTLGAGDVFHGAFAWAAAARHAAGLPVPEDPTALIRFAGAVATLSTRTFGTRAWRDEDALVDLVRRQRARVDAENDFPSA